MPRPVIPIEPPYTPELLPDVVAHIEQYLQLGMSAFEFGSGHSTVWLAQRVKRVVAIEHDPEWYAETEQACRTARVWSRVELVLVEEAGIAPSIMERGEYDFILVDGLDRQRVASTACAIDHLKPGGMFVLDDTNWAMLADARQMLNDTGWERVVFSGQHTRKNGRIMPHRTSIFRRPHV